MNISTIMEESLLTLSDSRILIHLTLTWVLSLVLCVKLFALIFSKKEAEVPIPQDKVEEHNVPAKASPGLMGPPASPPPRSPVIPSRLNQTITMKGGRFIKQLELEVCQKAKEAGKHPSYSDLVLSLVHNYNLDITSPVLPRGFTIFHSACLSCSPELVSSLSPLAEPDQNTSQGESPLYLAVYAAGHRLAEQPQGEGEGLEVVRHLLQAGFDLNTVNTAGLTALHQAQKQGHANMIRSGG